MNLTHTRLLSALMVRSRDLGSTQIPQPLLSSEPVNLSPLRPHPEEPERSEGVSKDGRESEAAAMVRDGALRAPPHHEAERVELVPNRQD